MVVGQRVPVLDAHERVTGSLTYTLNVELPGMLHACLVTSPLPHARIREVDLADARRLPGVRAAVCSSDLAGLGIAPLLGRPPHQRPVLAFDRVRFVGEPVAAVAAEDEDTAREAAELVRVEYEELPAVTGLAVASEPNAPLVHGSSNIIVEHRVSRGDLQAGLALADEVFEDEFTTPAVHHCSLEPHCCLAVFTGERLTVWSASQTPFGLRQQLARLLGFPQSHVRVVVPSLGGGFGGKLGIVVEPAAVALARASRRPVKLILPRSQEFLTLVRHPSVIRLRTAVTRDGTIVAREARCLFGTGAYSSFGRNGILNGAYAAAGSPYRIPHVRVQMLGVYTNTTPACSFRAPGVPQGAWASESQLDMVADRLGIDRLELRRKNLLRNGDRFVGGGRVDDLHFEEMLERATEALGWRGQPLPSISGPGPRDGRSTSRRGYSVLPTLKTTRTPTASNALLKLDEDGSVYVLVGSVEMGQGARTALAQIAAQALDVPYERVTVAQVDTDSVPFDENTTSSRTTYIVGGAVRRAALDLREQLRALAAERLEAAPDDVVLEGGLAHVRGAMEPAVSYGELIQRSGRGELAGHGHFSSRATPDPETGRPGASAHWHHGVVATEVEVDTETGHVEVAKLWAGVYAGQIVNPALCELQAQGSVLFGLGEAMFEGMQYEDGRPVTTSFSEYNVPSMLDAPADFPTRVMEEPGSDEIHGVGETLVPPVLAVIGNAVADAVGVHLRELPLTPERILVALNSQLENAPIAKR